jgi:cytochrome c oxidase subunit 3
MSQTATATGIETENLWNGGKSPFKVRYGKLMMWLFLLSDVFTFSGLLISYGSTRFSYGDNINMPWPRPDMVFNHFPFAGHTHLPLFFVSLMTFILIFSSVTMVLAVEAGQRMQKKEVAKYMLLTIIGGIAFLSCQAWEWTQFIGDKASLRFNQFSLSPEGIDYANSLQLFKHYEWTEGLRIDGPPTFSALFFIVTGFHGFHVLSGVVLNIVVYLNVLKGTYEKRGHYEMIEKVGLYWHFVDLVWVFVFTFFYLI